MTTSQFTAVYSDFINNTADDAARQKYVKRLKENNAELEALKAACHFSYEICRTSPDYEIVVANSKISNFLFHQLDIIP
jgi:hypothetical protein